METNYAVHPGALLAEDLESMDMTQRELSNRTGISTTIINELIKGKRSMNIGIAKKLEEVFGISAEFWMNVQTQYDLKAANPDNSLLHGQTELTKLGYTANQIADRLICYDSELSTAEGYEPCLTNLRLQKLLYFAQKEFVRNGKILFDDSIYHWQYGPVVKTVYHRFKDMEDKVLPHVADTPLRDEDEKLLRSAFNKYNKYVTSHLVTLTHKDKAWANSSPNDVITPQTIREYL